MLLAPMNSLGEDMVVPTLAASLRCFPLRSPLLDTLSVDLVEQTK